MSEIVKVLFFILLCNLVFIYFIVKPPVDKRVKLSIKNQIRVVRLLFTTGIVLILTGFLPFFRDVVGYLKNGDTYLKKDICIIEKEIHLPIFTSTKKTAVCKNGDYYTEFFTTDFFNQGEIYRFYFLPESRVVIKQELLHSSKSSR